MITPLLLLLAQATALNPQAAALFERDPVLRAWAVSRFDHNRDGWLTLYEVQAAVAALKGIADADHDGRVTQAEFVRARTAIATGPRPRVISPPAASPTAP
jgi:hypothetical protein